jgi:hypothetical protein
MIQGTPPDPAVWAARARHIPRVRIFFPTRSLSDPALPFAMVVIIVAVIVVVIIVMSLSRSRHYGPAAFKLRAAVRAVGTF